MFYGLLGNSVWKRRVYSNGSKGYSNGDATVFTDEVIRILEDLEEDESDLYCGDTE
jgi:hypothetical protein